MKRKIATVLCVLFIIGYFTPRSAYKVLHTKVNIPRIEQVRVTRSYSNSEEVLFTLDKKYEREPFWNLLRDIKVVRFPVSWKKDASETNPRYTIELMRDYEVQHVLELGSLDYSIDDRDYILLDYDAIDFSGFEYTH